MELRDYARAVGRHWPLVLATVALSVGMTAALTDMAPPTYRSSTVLFASAEGANGNSDVVAQRLQTYVALVTGPRIAAAVAQSLRPALPPEQVQSKIEASVGSGTVLLTITATDASSTQARLIATAAARELTKLAKELEPERAGATAPVTLAVAQPAETTRVPTNRLRNLGFAGALGLLLAAALTAARESLRTVIRSDEDIRALTELKTLAVIPKGSASGSPATLGERSDEPRAEALRKLRTRLRSAAPTMGPASFLFTSSVRGEGATLTACGLAAALTEDGSRVALVDADLRRPRVHTYLGVSASPGLSDILVGAATVEDVMRESVNRRLWVLPAGDVPANPGELLASPAMAEAIRILEKGFDVVVVNAPPVLPVADPAVLSALTSGVLLVVRSGRTRLDQIDRATDLLRDVNAPVVGVVLNTVPRFRLRRPHLFSWFGRFRGGSPRQTRDDWPLLLVEPGQPPAAIAQPALLAIQSGSLDDAATDLGRHWKRIPLG